MTDIALTPSELSHSSAKPKLDAGLGPTALILFVGLLTAGVLFTAWSIWNDVTAADAPTTTYLPFVLLGVALVIALGFEFVNGFHDTANAVATVIYTHALPPNVAVMWSGFWNFLGVAFSTGAVAFGIVTLLPVELILQVGSDAGFAMVFALLIAAIIWNLSTWWFGIPASSSHTMIGSIIGVGVGNALLRGRDGTSGVDWGKATEIGYSLLLSPVFGFVCAAVLFLVLRFLVKSPALYEEPKGHQPPPWWIRAILIFTCTGVSFFHGSNDGQKGMGLIMLILIGTVPTAYALNRAMPESHTLAYQQASAGAVVAMAPFVKAPAAADVRADLTEFVRTRKTTDTTVASFQKLTLEISDVVAQNGTLGKVPAAAVGNVRNDMYLASETARFLLKTHGAGMDAQSEAKIKTLQKAFDDSTKFIPLWVKIAVAIALGLGTMVGWKRIVVTVGEKIGKTHLTYAQGASAEIVAMATIGAADGLGLPVSTTHVLSSGVAGTMTAHGSGLQLATLRNLLMAWVLTLPVAILLSGSLYALFRQVF
ncbi:inorganic phosphate transporter [Siculibacillus lacustris]|uniref:Phosphate transporter n=1 Tax=Siculibacillus lacustris TaxID=1549641 RepID=A0A4Q9VKL7_9HYPH|nr:inorganic phosphate transporter [Siculibacillus lacustris]TBW35963.1 inorganic phosphate transporter [Siculibacillus lacustris]